MTPRALALLAVLAVACNPHPKEAHDADVASPVPSAAPSPSPSSAPAPSSVPGSPAASCAKDDDCRLFSSYCQEAPCACRALGPRDPTPTCLGGAASNVRCFADPCMKKAAQCQSGACVVTVR